MLCGWTKDELSGSSAAAPGLTETVKAAMTTATRPRALTELVISCARLPVLRPIQLRMASDPNARIPRSLTCPASTGRSSPANSAKATARVALATDWTVKSQQPTTNPAFSPKSAARVNVPPARTGKHATKLGDGTAAQERVDSSEQPNHKDQPATP